MISVGDAVAAAGGTPVYLAHPSRLAASMDAARRSLAAHVPVPARVAYSVKTNYLAEFVRQSDRAGHVIEVVSENEFDYVLGLGVRATNVMINGPIKEPRFVLAALGAGAQVNVDSMEELIAVEEALGAAGANASLGLRVAAHFDDGRVGRFGVDVDVDDHVAALRAVLDRGRIEIDGLHIHHSSRRDAASFGDRLQTLVAAADRLGLANVRRLDLGGGFASVPPPEIAAQLSYPIASMDECAIEIGRRCRELGVADRWSSEILIEPGIGVLADTMDYVVSVCAVKELPERTAIISDGSLFEVNPLRSSISPPARPARDVTSRPGRAASVFGATCMEIDVLSTFADCPDVTLGDHLVVVNVGAYALSLAPEFIQRRAGVVCADTGRLLRPRAASGSFPGGGT